MFVSNKTSNDGKARKAFSRLELIHLVKMVEIHGTSSTHSL